MYSRTIGDRVLTFGVSGKLWKNALVMFDRETGSEWSQVTGEAISGPLKGQRLTLLPSAQTTTWGKWKKLHPDTRVLSVDGKEAVLLDTYEDYHRSSERGVRPMPPTDSRLPPKSKVMGVQVGRSFRAYPFSAVDRKGYLEDSLGGRHLLLYRDKNSGFSAVYSRTVDGELLKFKGGVMEGRVRDAGGSVWDLETGRAVSGKHRGQQLFQVPHIDLYWFAWAAYHPETSVWPHVESEMRL